MRCLLDKVTARHITEGMLKLVEGRTVTSKVFSEHQFRQHNRIGGNIMKSRSWKKGVFYLTLVVSISFGVLMATKTAFYQHFFEPLSDKTQNIAYIQYEISMTTQLGWLAEFLIMFAVPFGLVWLLSFLTMRIFVRDFTVSDWSLSLTRSMQAKDSRN